MSSRELVSASDPEDRRWMGEALRLALGGVGRVEPNPPVGAIVVREGLVLGRGFHRAYGGPHAEVHALRQAGDAAKGATLYVTLEPCSTTGRTPPCVEEILRRRIARVVVAVEDPNPVHRGGGLKRLVEAGVQVCAGVGEESGEELLGGFRRALESPYPFVVLKWAMTLDGKTGTRTGDSKWITGEKARRWAHRFRRECDGVLVGISTVLADDPELTVRHVRPRNPVRIVADSRLRIPRECKLVRSARSTPTWILTGRGTEPARRRGLEEAGCQVIEVDPAGDRLDLELGLRELRARGLRKVLLEGGGKLAASAQETGAVGGVLAFVAPRISGGENAPTPLGGTGVESIRDASRLQSVRTRWVGEDLLFQGRV